MCQLLRLASLIQVQILVCQIKAAENSGCLPQPIGQRDLMFFCLFVFIRLTRLQVKLAEVLGGAEGDHHHAVPEDVLPCGHLESDLCAGDETVLLDHWVDRLHPAVPEVYPGVSKESRKIKSYNHKKQILKSQCE